MVLIKNTDILKKNTDNLKKVALKCIFSMLEGQLSTSSPCGLIRPSKKNKWYKTLCKLYYFKPTPIKVTEKIKEESELKSHTAFWGNDSLSQIEHNQHLNEKKSTP